MTGKRSEPGRSAPRGVGRLPASLALALAVGLAWPGCVNNSVGNPVPPEDARADMAVSNRHTSPIDVIVDGQVVGTVQTGETVYFDVLPGVRDVLVREQSDGLVRYLGTFEFRQLGFVTVDYDPARTRNLTVVNRSGGDVLLTVDNTLPLGGLRPGEARDFVVPAGVQNLYVTDLRGGIPVYVGTYTFATPGLAAEVLIDYRG